jgi:hypothetical protein
LALAAYGGDALQTAELLDLPIGVCVNEYGNIHADAVGVVDLFLLLDEIGNAKGRIVKVAVWGIDDQTNTVFHAMPMEDDDRSRIMGVRCQRLVLRRDLLRFTRLQFSLANGRGSTTVEYGRLYDLYRLYKDVSIAPAERFLLFAAYPETAVPATTAEEGHRWLEELRRKARERLPKEIEGATEQTSKLTTSNAVSALASAGIAGASGKATNGATLRRAGQRLSAQGSQ